MKNYGFIKPQFDRTQYILGQGMVPLKVLRQDGNWKTGLPVKEHQYKGFETYNCTSFNTLNAIEQFMFVAFGEIVNYSDRFVGIMAGTKAPGNDPHLVMEAIRKYGLIPEDMLPFSDDIKNIDEYYSFKGANKEDCLKAGQEWLKKYSFFHEWVFHPDNTGMPQEERIHNMKVALKYSPLCTAVYAWFTNDKGHYVRFGDDNHWTSITSIDEFQNAFDSYEPFEKIVEQTVFYCKRIHIERIAPKLSVKESWFIRIINFFKKIFI